MRIKILGVVTLLAAAGLPTAIASLVISPPEHATPAQPVKPKQEATTPVAKSEAKSDGKTESRSDAKAATKSSTKYEGKPSRDAREAASKPADAHAEPAETMSASKPAGNALPSAASESAVTADQALALLTEGNARWVANAPQAPNTDSARRADVAENGQKPFVTVITCADSRLPVERLFDRGVGDLFVVRVAGNVAGGSETGTIEYGIEHLHTPLLVVMGHTKCGAVAAAASGADLHGYLGDLISQITPAVDRAKRANPGLTGNDLAAASVKENVWQTVFQLFKNSPECLAAVQAGKVKVVGAVCDISTGKVEWMGEHPWQRELLAAFAPKADHAVHALNEGTNERAGHADRATGHADMQTASHGDEHEEN
jgi:carbonic anhydrase